ncbi:hypothetical protein [Methanothermobacter thermautotrophicus]|uniref:hypothetical protein n=1 Tax=Methanothermobacter thermautotrophicus TaxID=145262 RepID=UPI0022B9CF54|nr:hypothetical protein [Methanothermobacter thermautotrophicus]WBF07449.1 hypothetical protein ISG36_05310 [Methanothermobacter thermautotrophicus]
MSSYTEITGRCGHIIGVAIAILAYIVYMQTDHYKMSMMDRNAKKGEKAYEDACTSFNHTRDYIQEDVENMNPIDAAHATDHISKTSENLNKSMESWKTAYRYAKDPYKKFIRMQIDILENFKEAVNCIFKAIDCLNHDEKDKLQHTYNKHANT